MCVFFFSTSLGYISIPGGSTIQARWLCQTPLCTELDAGLRAPNIIEILKVIVQSIGLKLSVDNAVVGDILALL